MPVDSPLAAPREESPAQGRVGILLTTASEKTVTIGLLCYLAGFLVLNFYFGSIGTSSIDAARVRYILVGLLFLLFIFSFAYPFHGARRIIQDRRAELLSGPTVGTLLGYSVNAYLYVHSITSSVFVAAGASVDINRLLAPPTGAGISILHALEVSSQIFLFLFLVVPVLVVALGAALIPLAILFLQPTMRLIGEVRRVRLRDLGIPSIARELARAAFNRRTALNGLRIIGAYAAAVFALSFALAMLLEAVNEGNQPFYFTWNNVTASFRFTLLSILIYMIGLTSSFVATAAEEKTKVPLAEGRPPAGILPAGLSGAVALTSVVLPIYALALFPRVPQSIGGGNPRAVCIQLKDPASQLLAPPSSVYLLDRGATTTILAVAGPLQPSFQVIEVSNDQIATVTSRPTSNTACAHSPLDLADARTRGSASGLAP